MPSPAPTDEVPEPRDRLWLELSEGDVDAEVADTVYRFDLTWLTSAWTCIFGAGCPGIDQTRPDAGCCVHGAYFAEEADEQRVAEAVARLSPQSWANHDHPRHGSDGDWAVTDDEGDARTALVDGVCVFHNPKDFAGGYGCALHALALTEGIPPLQTKPDVCWQLPLRRTYATVERPDGSEYLQLSVTEYTRAGWGGGGADFDWYCSTSPSAHVGAEPVWRSLRDELVELVGVQVYDRLAEHCEQLTGRRRRRLLPLTVHPATPRPARAGSSLGEAGPDTPPRTTGTAQRNGAR